MVWEAKIDDSSPFERVFLVLFTYYCERLEMVRFSVPVCFWVKQISISPESWQWNFLSTLPFSISYATFYGLWIDSMSCKTGRFANNQRWQACHQDRDGRIDWSIIDLYVVASLKSKFSCFLCINYNRFAIKSKFSFALVIRHWVRDLLRWIRVY